MLSLSANILSHFCALARFLAELYWKEDESRTTTMKRKGVVLNICCVGGGAAREVWRRVVAQISEFIQTQKLAWPKLTLYPPQFHNSIQLFLV